MDLSFSDTKPRIAHFVRVKTAKFGKLEIIDTITSDCKEIGFLMDFNPKGQIKLMESFSCLLPGDQSL